MQTFKNETENCHFSVTVSKEVLKLFEVFFHIYFRITLYRGDKYVIVKELKLI